MSSFQYGFFDELLKLAATADELNAASERMRGNAGILTTREVIPRKLPKYFRTAPSALRAIPAGIGTPIPPNAVRPVARRAYGERKQYSGIMSSPADISKSVHREANLRAPISPFDTFQDINDARARGDISAEERKKLLENHAAIVNSHETREFLEGRRVGAPGAEDYLNTSIDAKTKARKLLAAHAKTLGSSKYPRKVPVLNIDQSALDTLARFDGNQYEGHVSPRLIIDDLRQAHTMGRSSEFAKAVNSDPTLRRQVEAHERGMGKENIRAKLKAKRDGYRNWRQARATRGMAAETAQLLRPTKETGIIRMRALGNVGVPELAPARWFLEKSLPWAEDPRLNPYFRGDKPFAPWMRKSFMRAWDRTGRDYDGLVERAREFNPASASASIGTPKLQKETFKDALADMIKKRRRKLGRKT